MLSENPRQVLQLLQSGNGVEIGGGIKDGRRSSSSKTRLSVVLGFAAIYLIWGSTYLGIRYAVETIPPLLMMGVRHSVAGVLVYCLGAAAGRDCSYEETVGICGGRGTFAVSRRTRNSSLGGTESGVRISRFAVRDVAAVDGADQPRGWQ